MEILALSNTDRENVLVYQEMYRQGDIINIYVEKVPAFYVVRIDDTIEETLVYLIKDKIEYKVPFGSERDALNPKSFMGSIHYISIREAREFEIKGIRNISKNVIDQHEANGCYPHSSANIETRNESVFAAKNAIDGLIANDYHGIWPYGSWGINMQDDAEFLLEFGRAVDIYEIDIYTRSDFPHDNWWIQGTITFSNGKKSVINMDKSEKPHVFKIVKRGILWIKLSDLIKANVPSPFPALTQIIVYGKESKNRQNNSLNDQKG